MSQLKDILALVACSDPSVTELNLSFKNLGDKEVALVAEALKRNKNVTVLGLYGNQIGDVGALALADAISGTKALRVLFLMDNRIGDKGVEGLADALVVNASLTELNLKRNLFSVSGAARLVRALQKNASLIKLQMSTFDPKVKESRNDSLNRNKGLVAIVRSAALFLIGIRNGSDFEGMGYIGCLPKEVVKMIAKRVWGTCGQSEWIQTGAHVSGVAKSKEPFSDHIRAERKTNCIVH